MRASESATTWEARRGDSRSFRDGQLGVESCGDEIIAEAIHGCEDESFHAQRLSRLDIDELVIDEEGFFRQGAELFEDVAIDGRIGLRQTQLETPNENIEVIDPL